MKRYTFDGLGPLTKRQMIAAWLFGLALVIAGLTLNAFGVIQ